MASITQQALDLATTVYSRLLQNTGNERDNLLDICTAVQLLAQNALSATPSTDIPDPGATAVDASTTIAAVDPVEGT